MKSLSLDRKGASFISSLILLLIAIMVAAALVSTVSWESEQAADNEAIVGGEYWNETSGAWQAAAPPAGEGFYADGVPGGPALISLWPLLFIIAPILYIVKQVFF